MDFPQNAVELRTAMNQRWEKAVELGKKSDVLKQESDQLHNVSFILARLLTSWDNPDLYRMSSGGHAYFFLQPGIRARVIVQEFLPDGKKPYHNYSVIPFAEIAKGECPACHQDDCPVVEHSVRHKRLKERILLCLNCNTATVLASKTRSERIDESA